VSALEPHPAPAPQPGHIVPVARGVHWLRMPVAFAPGHVNVWALEDEDEDGPCWTLVDAGFPDDATRTNWTHALAGDLAERPVRRILITHCHPDHFGLGEWLARQTGARIWMSLGEFMTAQAWFGTVPASDMGLMADFFVLHGLGAEHTDAMRGESGRYQRVVGELPVAMRRILPGETLRIGQDDWTAIVGYGHSPEHLAFHRANDPVLIAGDMLLPRISPNTPTLAYEPEIDAVGQYIDSIERFRTLPGDTVVLPAHGDPYVGVTARIDALQAHHAERLALIVDLCAEPKSAAELLPSLFKRTLDSFQTRFAMGEVIAHLNHLWQAGRLRRLPGQDGVIRHIQSLPVSGGAKP
jgi:glyoxylase-like metal-dependent hydrolase (beta-lactamase superfamily II)